MIAGVLLLAIAAIGAAYGGLVIKAAPGRRDNVVFGALAISDALMITWRAINVLTGECLTADAAEAETPGFTVDRLLAHFPVALLAHGPDALASDGSR